MLISAARIIGKQWANESQEVRDKYKRKSNEAALQHSKTYPGYQYQPRKPSEKKKRMTKNKLAKLAAKSASAKSADEEMVAPVAPVLTINANSLSFVAGEGAPGQLAAALNDFNTSTFTAAQLASAAAHGGQGHPVPAASSTAFVADSINMDMITHYPVPAASSSFITSDADANYDAMMDPIHDATRAAALLMPDLDELDIVLPYDQSLTTSEVSRQFGLNEEVQDGLNDFFDFGSFK